MNRCAALLLLCTLPALAAAAAAGEPLRPYSASYTVSWHGMNAGTSSFTLRQENADEWSYESRNQPRGLFSLVAAASATLHSRMSVSDAGVRPLRFTATSSSGDQVRADLQFDWTANRVSGQFEGETIDMALRAGVQDDLSVQVALIHALLADQPPAGIALFDHQGIRDYAYTRVGEATLHTPLGDVATVIYRSQRAYSPRSTRFWCAPAYGFIPLRAEQQRAGKVEWTMELRSLQRDAAPVAPVTPAP